jgi:hypothetical protein
MGSRTSGVQSPKRAADLRSQVQGSPRRDRGARGTTIEAVSYAGENQSVEPAIYSLQFRGQAAEVAPGVLRAVTAAPSSALATTVGGDGFEGFLELVEGDDARFESEVAFSDETTFREEGTIDFGGGNRLRFRTVGVGWLGQCPEPELKHGAVIWEIDGGDGCFDGAQGLITSNFLVSDIGDVTDNQFGVVFVR